MKIDRCLNSDTEKVNGELFVKAPPPCMLMSSPTGASSCWIPRESVPEVLSHNGGIFMLVPISGTTLLFAVTDLITFSGGDVLAMTRPVGAAVPYSTRRGENTIQ